MGFAEKRCATVEEVGAVGYHHFPVGSCGLSVGTKTPVALVALRRKIAFADAYEPPLYHMPILWGCNIHPLGSFQ